MRKKKKFKGLAASKRKNDQAVVEVMPTRVPSASWRKINNSGPVPIAPPADFIQLTPIVQPIPLVPYSTQRQPLAMFEDEEDYY